MNGGDVAFALLALNPFGGLLLAIPFAILRLHYSAPLALGLGIPLAYVQVVVVDLGWTHLDRVQLWRRLLERRRSARVERLMASGGAFFTTLVLAPILGPWLVMAFMRYARVPQRRVALPILLGLGWMSVLVAAGCLLVPRFFESP